MILLFMSVTFVTCYYIFLLGLISLFILVNLLKVIKQVYVLFDLIITRDQARVDCTFREFHRIL